MKGQQDSRTLTMVDVLALLTLCILATFFGTKAFNQAEEINRLEQQNVHLGEQLNETQLKLDFYQKGVTDSN